MKTSRIIALLVCLSVLSAGGCLAARLNNSFDLKGPRGMVGYLLALLPGGVSCRFDEGSFDSCAFGP